MKEMKRFRWRKVMKLRLVCWILGHGLDDYAQHEFGVKRCCRCRRPITLISYWKAVRS